MVIELNDDRFQDELRDPDFVNAYLEAFFQEAQETGDTRLLLLAVRNVLRARDKSIVDVAERLGKSRPSLHKTLSGASTPLLDTFMALLPEIGVRIRFEYQPQHRTQFAATGRNREGDFVTMTPPAVFIIHATDDQDRFVTDFATKLVRNGIDAWYSKWEIKPGDSLVGKIFEEGLKDAQAVVVVVSENSIDRPWVKEEINAGFVRRVEGTCKIIPVILDGCKAPMALASTVWVPINDLDNYDDALRSIVDSIFGYSGKPTIGTPPSYVASPMASIPGLTQHDVLVLKALCETEGVEKHKVARISNVLPSLLAAGLSKTMVLESAQMLKEEGYLSSPSVRADYFYITEQGFDTYASAFLPQYKEVTQQVAGAILNQGLKTPAAIKASGVNASEAIIQRILFVFESHSYIKIMKVLNRGDRGTIIRVDPRFKRWFDSQHQ